MHVSAAHLMGRRWASLIEAFSKGRDESRKKGASHSGTDCNRDATTFCVITISPSASAALLSTHPWVCFTNVDASKLKLIAIKMVISNYFQIECKLKVGGVSLPYTATGCTLFPWFASSNISTAQHYLQPFFSAYGCQFRGAFFPSQMQLAFVLCRRDDKFVSAHR